MKMHASPRIEAVAERAGTSTITVSRTLRQPHLVKPVTRERVLRAVEELGYIPHSSASALASGRSGFVGVLTPTLAHSIFAETLRGVSDAVSDKGLQILLGDFGYSVERRSALLRTLAGRQVEAIVAIGLLDHPADRRMLASLSIPVVETWDLTTQPIDSVVGFSNRTAGALVARHFLASGRRQFGFVGSTDQRAVSRRAGFAAIARRGGASVISVSHDAHGSIEAGRRLISDILRQNPNIDAVFFSTDALAVGGLAELQDRGIVVPDQIALAGLGDLELGRVCRPQLTTVSVNAYEIGARAGAIVAAALDGDTDRPKSIKVDMKLIARGTAP